MNDETEVRYLTVEQCAEMRGMTKAAVDQERHEGRGPVYTRIGRQIRYRQSDVIEFMDSHRVNPGDSNKVA